MPYPHFFCASVSEMTPKRTASLLDATLTQERFPRTLYFCIVKGESGGNLQNENSVAQSLGTSEVLLIRI